MISSQFTFSAATLTSRKNTSPSNTEFSRGFFPVATRGTSNTGTFSYVRSSGRGGEKGEIPREWFITESVEESESTGRRSYSGAGADLTEIGCKAGDMG